MKPLISIVVPIYKVEKYLQRCVDSLLGQTYSNLEIILVNDGSPDRCGEMCDDYQSRDERVVVIHKENGGLSDARNFGIDRASGDLITFVDSDDWLHSELISRLYFLMATHDADIAACNFLKVYEGSATPPATAVDDRVLEFTNIEAVEELDKELGVQMVVAWGKLYKRRLFGEIRYPKGRLHEDEFTTHKLLFEAGKIVFTHEALVFYFQRGDSITGTGFDIRKKMDFMDAMYERAGFLKLKGLNKLSDIAYRDYFFALLANLDYLQSREDHHRADELRSKGRAALPNLRDGAQSTKFRLLVESYGISPSLGLSFFKKFSPYAGNRR